jgi:sugar phosphate isomerase/epimerase
MTCPSFAFDICLAQWSLHKAFFSGELAALDFPRIARQRYDIGAVEYVNQFFMDKAEDLEFLQQLKRNAAACGVKSQLLMIDHEGELAATQAELRQQAVAGHEKWLKAAAFLGCAAVRVNLHGEVNESQWLANSVASLCALGDMAEPLGLKVLVENHGGLSANINLLVQVIRRVNRHNVGTMPDFGNFCIRRQVPGDLWQSPCVERYDPYQGVAKMLPYACAISAKTYDFDADGRETSIDFERMMTLISNSGYSGSIAVEYEGERLSEDQGIRRSKALLQTWQRA